MASDSRRAGEATSRRADDLAEDQVVVKEQFVQSVLQEEEGKAMLTYVLNRGGETSLYEQLYRALRADIESGALAAGARLPSKRAFAKHLGVSVVTVEGALDQLVAEGYVRAVPRSGFYVQEIGPNLASFSRVSTRETVKSPSKAGFEGKSALGVAKMGVSGNDDVETLEKLATKDKSFCIACGEGDVSGARVAKIGDKYYVTWCNGYHGPTIGIAWTDDFETFHQLENAFLPYNRNGVLFPRKIGGRFAMLSRPSDTGHTPFGDIFYSESPDMEFWGRHRHVMSPSAFEVSAWQCMKIGAGPVPIETSEGWLLFYHGVLRSCNGYVYAFGSALLNLEEPWKVTARSGPYLISPRETYECMGDVPNVTFPCASLHDPATGRVAVYYGCADTVTGLAFGYIPEIIDFTKQNSIL